MKTISLISALAISAQALAISPTEFANPPAEYRPVPLWFWNNTTVDTDSALTQLKAFTDLDGYGGCAILPFGGNFKPEYLSDSYFDVYGAMVRYAAQNGLTMSLYDEYGFPSGSMGAINGDGTPRFMARHPDATIKRLDKFEYPLENGTVCTQALPNDGKLMSLVAVDENTHKIVPLSDHVKDDVLTWDVPATGRWVLMCFMCVKDGDPNVDYLDPDAVSLFVEETHGEYFKRFPEAFGPVITETFCDEPTMYRAQGRMWTDSFNDRFEAEYGFSPECLYPALWHNIGPDTPAARNYLFGFRAKLYSEGFMKTIHDWASAHGIKSTGHQDQEEVLNPVSVSGDLMLCGKYMDIPGIDKIGGDRPAELFYKVVSSSAANWDKSLVMSETFGAMGNIPVEQMYSIAMDQYAKGINQLIPHAVWYNDADVTFLPELSWRNHLYNTELPEFNRFLSRLNYVLRQPGRIVADIALLYPIETMQAGHYLDGPEGFYAGGVKIAGTDYVNVASILSDTICRDFTYLHPERFEQCSVRNGMLNMDNAVNHQHFRVLILPGVKCMSPRSLAMVEEFRRAGGKVIFTTSMPDASTDFSVSGDEIRKRAAHMLTMPDNPAIYLPEPNAANIKEALHDNDYAPDVDTDAYGLRCLHKVVENHDIYYFANPGDQCINAKVRLRDSHNIISAYNPHTGECYKYSTTTDDNKGGTIFDIELPAAKSLFLVAE